MKKIKSALPVIFIIIEIFITSSCSGNGKINQSGQNEISSGQYRIYIVNSYLHTGIIISPANKSSEIITALKYFKYFRFTDIGWGEERFYQDPDDNYCMGAKAILLPNRSVIRIEGYNGTIEDIIGWSDFTVMLELDSIQFTKLTQFIEKSFMKNSENEIVITSSKRSGEVIFFKSVHRYYLFNTCNTWVAKALKSSGLKISPFFVITAKQLFNKIKNQGTVLKTPE